MANYRILEVAEAINQLVADLPLGSMQEKRMQRKHGQAASSRWRLFGRTLINKQEDYIFHRGGSMEFQFNLGEEADPNTGKRRVRYGLALSYQPTREIPGPLNSLAGQTSRLNKLIEDRSALLNGLSMTVYFPERKGETHYDAHQPFDELLPVRRSFYFVGRFVSGTLQDLSDEEIRGIAYGLNDMLPLYEAVEFGPADGVPVRVQQADKESAARDTLREVLFPAGGGKKPEQRRAPTPSNDVDYLAGQARNKAIGDGGESLVVAHERKKLIDTERPDLAELVEKMLDGTGYDVRSYDEDGVELHIEVKTTTSGINAPFFLSKNEWLYATDRQNPFIIYRLHNYNTELNTADFFIINNPEGQLDLVPEVYKVYRQ